MKSEFDDLIGKPYGEFGRGPDFYDCWGSVCEAGKRMGENTPDYKDISYLNLRGVLKAIKEMTVLPEYELIIKPERRAIVMFKIIGGWAHFGRMIDKRYFIHATEELGVHISSINGFYGPLVKGLYLCRQ